MLTWAICWLVVSLKKNEGTVSINFLALFIMALLDVLIVYLIAGIFK